MASRALAARREAPLERELPYARHVTDSVVALDSGALMTSFQLEGVAFETADGRTLNDLHEKLNGAWRNLADPSLAVWHHLIRQPYSLAPASALRTSFARQLDEAYRARLAERRMFANRLYLTLVLHPRRDTIGAQRRFGRRASSSDEGVLKRLEVTARDLAAQLERYDPRRLGLLERGGLLFSEPAEMLRELLAGEPEPVPLVRGRIGSAIHTTRLIFGREVIELRAAHETRYAAMLGLKEYPASTCPGLWDPLLAAPFPFVMSQSFAFLSKAAAQTALGRKQNQMRSAGDKALSQVDELTAAQDDLAANRFVMGEHQASLLVRAGSLPELADRIARARAALADAGLVTAREDLALEAAFWAQFPGNFRFRPRPAAITSRNFAALAPFHTHPIGRPEGHHWGPAVAALRTTAGSPHHFSFHQADLGHTFVCGPSGSGKTVLQTFLLAQLERHGAQRVLIDKDRGAEPFVRACGGTYLDLRNGRPTGLAPLKTLSEAPGDRRFLADLVTELVGRGAPLSAVDSAAIEAAVDALLPLPPSKRSFTGLRALLGQRDPGGAGARLERWTADGPLGWALDNATDDLDLADPLLGLDVTELLDHPEVRGPILSYLFHRLASLRDGRRLVIDIDEFWKALGDPAFRALANDGLKTFRKQNAVLILGTQSPADVLLSPIAHTILEQCATKIFLPNPHATERDYIGGFGLTPRELHLIRDELTPASHRFLVRQGGASMVAELDLGGVAGLESLARQPG